MKLREIAEKPTSVSTKELEAKLKDMSGGGLHESAMFRSYWALKQVVDWLERGVPGDVVLELIQEIEEA